MNFTSGLSITATKNTSDDFAYLDKDAAGLCVFGDITSSLQCAPSSDDNITSREFLTFTFAQNTWVNSISVNTNHDSVNYFQTLPAPKD